MFHRHNGIMRVLLQISKFSCLVDFLSVHRPQVDVAHSFVVAVGVVGVAGTLYHGVAERAWCDAVFPLLLADVALVESASVDLDFVLCCHNYFDLDVLSEQVAVSASTHPITRPSYGELIDLYHFPFMNLCFV